MSDPNADPRDSVAAQLVAEVQSLRTQLMVWKDELVEELTELTANLIEHYQQVIDRHLKGQHHEDFFETIPDADTHDDSDTNEKGSGDESDDHSGDGQTPDHPLDTNTDSMVDGVQRLDIGSQID